MPISRQEGGGSRFSAGNAVSRLEERRQHLPQGPQMLLNRLDDARTHVDDAPRDPRKGYCDPGIVAFKITVIQQRLQLEFEPNSITTPNGLAEALTLESLRDNDTNRTSPVAITITRFSGNKEGKVEKYSISVSVGATTIMSARGIPKGEDIFDYAEFPDIDVSGLLVQPLPGAGGIRVQDAKIISNDDLQPPTLRRT